MFTRYFLSSRSRPWPAQVGHGSSITVPEPPQRAHGRVIENRPWPSDSTPRPWQTGHTAGAVPGRAPVPRQVAAGRVRGDRDGHLRALDGLLERQRDRRLQVAAALGHGLRAHAAAAPAARGVEDPGQDVREGAEVGPGGAAAGGSAAAERPGPAEDAAAAVVALALLRIAEHVVGLGDLLEALLGAGVLVRVRVVLARELAVGLLDLVLRGLAVDAQRLVVVARARHRPTPPRRRGPGAAPRR